MQISPLVYWGISAYLFNMVLDVGDNPDGLQTEKIFNLNNANHLF